VDLPAADTLSRAADLIEQRAKAATQGEDRHLYDDPCWSADEDPGCTEPGELVLPVVRACDGEIVAQCEHRADADLIALLDPLAVAALVPLLRKAAKHCAIASGPVPLSLLWWGDLLEFARRLLREEETGG
jgi:hypothetical protein